eukprot:1154785-Pelagomonas_calceolata.AAC.2
MTRGSLQLINNTVHPHEERPKTLQVARAFYGTVSLVSCMSLLNRSKPASGCKGVRVSAVHTNSAPRWHAKQGG